MASMETILGQRWASDLERHLGYWLRRVSNRVSGVFARALQAKHTSVAEWVVLCHVQERPGITPGDLAEALDLTRGAVSKVIDKLAAKNWIACSAKPGDSRVQLLSPTRRGRRILPQLAEIADRNDREFFDGLDAGERAALRRLLGKLAEFHQIGDVPIE
jgi:DNA-binding MarR family transcriptional regulator